jgi:VanZ family protein
MKKTVLLALSVATAAAIFLFSAQSKVDSHALSERVASVVATQLAKVDALRPESANRTLKLLFEEHIRKIAHVCEYAVFGFLLHCTYAAFHKKRPCLWALATGAVFGITDELHQLLTQTRDALVGDVALDALGVALGVGLAAGILWIARLRRRGRLRKRALTAD